MNKEQHLKKLQKIWYNKLKKSGFEDIEQDETNLKRWESSRTARGKQNGETYEDRIVVHEAREEYYRMAGYLLNEHTFKNKTEKDIWALHSEGLSFKDIAEKLRTKKCIVNKDIVNKVVELLVVEMFKRYRNKNVEQE